MASGYRLLFDATSFNNRRQRTEMGLCYMVTGVICIALIQLEEVGGCGRVCVSFCTCKAPDRGDAPPITGGFPPSWPSPHPFILGVRRRASLIPGGYPLYTYIRKPNLASLALLISH